MNKKKYLLISLILLVIACNKEKKLPNEDKSFITYTNEEMINGLYNQIDLTDSLEVFEAVFNSLKSRVKIYPTENYYYSKFFCQGQWYICTMLFSASHIDSGIVYFGYSQKVDRRFQGEIKAKGGYVDLKREMGVKISKIKPFQYRLEYKNKRVDFILNYQKLTKPKKSKLMESEEYLGPVFDESGLQFHLLFDRGEKHMFFVLNEDQFVPEEFIKEKELLFGKRSNFVFYDDSIHNRKILIAVSAWNVYQNNWYDGPFDQLPDNHVYTGELDLKKYIEAAYPNTKGRIDKYGAFLNGKNRVAVSPYNIYYDTSDLNFVKHYKSLNTSLAKFYANITRNDH